MALQLISLGLVAAAAYYIYSVIHSIFFSPLSHVPGSLWCKISTVPSFYHAAKGDRHVWIWQQFQLYGETVRIAPNVVVFKSAAAYKDIYSVKSNVTRAKAYEIWQRTAEDVNTLNTSDIHVHRNKRRLLNLAFTEKSLRSAEDFIISHVDRWNELMVAGTAGTEVWSDPMNIAERSDFLSLDIMGDLSFGAQFNTKEPGENRFRQVPHTIHEYMKFTYPITKSPILSFLLWAKPRGLNALMNAATPPAVKDYYGFIEESVNRRRKDMAEAKEKGINSKKSAREDLLHYLFEAKHPEHGGPAYSKQELQAEANLLIIAGSDTTSIQLSSFFFYITHNQRCYEKATAEIRAAFSSAEEIRQSAQLSSCTYLRACLDEAMRLTPPGPAELGRLVLPGGQVVDGQHYPEGVVVGSSMWSSARHEDLGDPFVYRPERWIVDEKAGVTHDDVRRAKSFTHPFSAGPSNCVGQNLAMAELLITICRTLWRFDVRIEPGSKLGEGSAELGWGRRDPQQYMVRDYYISAREGPMLQFRRREAKQ